MSQQINLYDAALERQRDWLTFVNVAAGGATLLALFLAWGSWTHWRASDLEAASTAVAASLQQLRDQAASLDTQIKAMTPNPQLADELAGARLTVENRRAVLAVLQKGLGPGAASFADYLRGLARQGTGDPWLTGFSVDADGNAMEIRGRTLDPATVPDYIRRLNNEKVFQGQTFGALQMKSAASEAAPASQTGGGQAGAEQTASPQPAFSDFVLVPVKTAQTSAEKRP